jgi:simple sugar transport system substrate-binding protein
VCCIDRLNPQHCSGFHQASNLATFEAKYFEGGYLAGMAAAAVSSGKTIGFVGGYAIPSVVSMANAILLGARSIEPACICRVAWLNTWFDPGREREATNALIAEGADVLISMTDTPAAVQTAEARGVWSIGYASDLRTYAPNALLTSVVLDWSGIYLDAVQAVFESRWRSTNRWDDFQAGVVRVAPYHSAVPTSALNKIRQREASIVMGTVHPFAGPLRDSKGRERVPRGSILNDIGIRTMDWLVEGVTGTL